MSNDNTEMIDVPMTELTAERLNGWLSELSEYYNEDGYTTSARHVETVRNNIMVEVNRKPRKLAEEIGIVTVTSWLDDSTDSEVHSAVAIGSPDTDIYEVKVEFTGTLGKQLRGYYGDTGSGRLEAVRDDGSVEIRVDVY